MGIPSPTTQASTVLCVGGGLGVAPISVGATFSESFDFDVMSRVLGTARTRSSLTDSRRRRIHELLAVGGELSGVRHSPRQAEKR